MKTKSTLEKIHHAVLGWTTVFIVVLSFLFPLALIYFNHWIGFGGRFAFCIILVIQFGLVNFLFKRILDDYDLDNKLVYMHLLKLILISGIFFALAGLTIYLRLPGGKIDPVRTVYTVKSGHIAFYDNQTIWSNPFVMDTVFMHDLQSTYECESILFEKPLLISFKQTQIKIGISRNELLKCGIIGPNSILTYNEQVIKSIEQAKEITLLKSVEGINNHGLTHEQKLRFISIFENEIRENLPTYLEVDEVRIEQ